MISYCQSVSADAPSLNTLDKVASVSKQLNRSFNRDTAEKVYDYLKDNVTEQTAEELLLVGMCESGFEETAKNVNKNVSTDRGVFQINSVHGVSQEILIDPIENTKKALELYDDSGLRPWKSSEHCWSKGIELIK